MLVKSNNAAVDAKEDDADLGLIGARGDTSKDPPPPRSASDEEATLADRGAMRGSSIGDSFGAGGLGSIGTLGRGAGTGAGSGASQLGGAPQARSPQVKMGATSISGRLPPEVIQRIVRQNFGRFRLCYEKGLLNNPRLESKVAIRFVINKDGAVAEAADRGSDMPDGNVTSCVARAFSALSFPAPAGGIVSVTYPLQFSPSDSAAPTPAAKAPPPAPAPPRSP